MIAKNNNYLRGPNDKKWKEVVKKIQKRDKECRLMKVLNIRERYILIKNAPKNLLQILDPAHVIPASACRDLLYEEDNIVLLNRFSHSSLDSHKSPLDGKKILSEKEYHYWWERIIGKEKYKNLLEKADLSYLGRPEEE
jgi:hypothetical protein